jgi:ABC-type branched-subunit amino acid transport system ATPase component
MSALVQRATSRSRAAVSSAVIAAFRRLLTAGVSDARTFFAAWIDEPSLGLAPVVADATFNKIEEIHAMGMALLLVEQNVARALRLVRRAYVLESGRW